ncbi:18675_t:CDS:2, partial [Dentiscutata erythropus]
NSNYSQHFRDIAYQYFKSMMYSCVGERFKDGSAEKYKQFKYTAMTTDDIKVRYLKDNWINAFALYSEDSDECGKDNCVYCNDCNSKHWKENFDNWSSGDSNIDKIIKDTQLKAKKNYKIIEWIKFSNLKDIEYIGEGGFAKVYKAIWIDGPIENYEPWDVENKRWKRKADTMVAVKKLRVEIGMTSLELFQEIKCNLDHNSLFISRVYGVTKDPSTQEYAIVMQFQKNGDIRQLIRKNHEELNWIKYIEEEFNTSKEKEWKERLAKLADVSSPSKETRQQYTSRRLDYSKMLSQKLQELYRSDKIYEVDTYDEDNYDDSKLIDLVIP